MMIEELVKTVGRPYRRYDEQGRAEGCMAPVYLLYPDSPRYDWPDDEKAIGNYMHTRFIRHAVRIAPSDVIPGDIILIKFPMSMMHPAVYIGNETIIHCAIDAGMELVRINMHRIKEAYRCRPAD